LKSIGSEERMVAILCGRQRVYLENESRDIYRVLGVIKDITERKKAIERVWKVKKSIA